MCHIRLGVEDASKSDSEERPTILSVNDVDGTRSGLDYHLLFPETVPRNNVNPKQAVKNKALPGLDEPFDYDLLAQLANVPARITMYDLLRLSPDIRQAVVKALSEADKYAPHVHQIEVHDVYKSEAYKRR